MKRPARLASLPLTLTLAAFACGPSGHRTVATSASSASSSGSGGAAGTGGTGGAGGTGGGLSACAPSELWAQGFMPVREVFVAPGGTGDGKMATPFGTIARALKAAKPGDHINVAAGTYDCSDTSVDGTAGAGRGTMALPILVQAAAGAVVDCGDPTQGSTSALQLHGVSYLVIEGLELRNASGHLIQVDGKSTGVLFKNVFAHRAGLACLAASQSDDVSVEDSELADSGLAADSKASNASGQLLDYVGVHLAHVARSRLHGAAGNGVGSGANVAVQLRGGSHDLAIAQNDIEAAYTAVNLGGVTGAQLFDPPDADYEGKNLVAYANVVRGPISVAFAAIGCQSCAIYNNTVDAAVGHEAVRSLPGNSATGKTSDTAGLDVANNLFVFSGAAPQDLFSAGMADQSGLTLASNLFFAGGIKVATIKTDVAVVGTPGVIVDQDPKLAAPPGDVHLRAGSPAVGKGKALMVTADRDGVCRTSWDIGAYAAVK